eukprot:3119598-Pleurochrysis_carterae.AAC.1
MQLTAQATVEWRALVRLCTIMSAGGLHEHNVPSDGSCWLWAILTDFDVLDDPKRPSSADRRLMPFLRAEMHAWLTSDDPAA